MRDTKAYDPITLTHTDDVHRESLARRRNLTTDPFRPRTLRAHSIVKRSETPRTIVKRKRT